MSATVHPLPGAMPPPAEAAERPTLNLTPAEVVDAAGGYQRPADQLRELHRRGFARAYIPKVGANRVILERAHYDAVVRGQFGQQPAANQPAPARTPAAPDRAGFKDKYRRKGKA